VAVDVQQYPHLCKVEPSLNWVLTDRDRNAIHDDVERDSERIRSAEQTANKQLKQSTTYTVKVTKMVPYAAPEPKSGGEKDRKELEPPPIDPNERVRNENIHREQRADMVAEKVTKALKLSGDFDKLTLSQRASLEGKIQLSSKLKTMPVPKSPDSKK
jgi:hypothetical protein